MLNYSFQLKKRGLHNYHVPSLRLGALGSAAVLLLAQENKNVHHPLKYLTACERHGSDDTLVTSIKGPEFIQ